METIDVSDLLEEEAKLIQELVNLLRQKATLTRPQPIFPEEEEIEFAEWPLGVKGELTREEIYDYL